MKKLYGIALSEYDKQSHSIDSKKQFKNGFKKLLQSLKPQIEEIDTIRSLYQEDEKLGDELNSQIESCIKNYALNVSSVLFGDNKSQILAEENINLYVQQTKKIIDLLTESYHDRLTGLFNNKFLETFPEERLKNYTIIYMDIDDFKKVNDDKGHHQGDIILQKFADFLKTIVRVKRKDYLVRKHGDEFIILLESVDKEVIERVITEIRNNEVISVTLGYNDNVDEPFKDRIHSADTKMMNRKKQKKEVLDNTNTENFAA